MVYRVELDIYNGPLDLLLYLIRRDELDIYDIPIARITDSYMEYVRSLKHLNDREGLDINLAGDFLVMAATLMEIKSAMLLPKPPPDPNTGEPTTAQELTDPRYELVQKLLEYKRFKDAAFALEQQHEKHQQRFPRIPALRDGNNDEPPPVDLDEVQIWDLLSAFQKLMAEVGQRKPKYHEVIYDDTPIDLHAADIEDRLKREKRLTFRTLMEGRKSRSEMIGVFLALLELIREKKVLVQQNESGSDIQIEPAPEEHRRTYPQASLHLAEEKANDAPSRTLAHAHHGRHTVELIGAVDVSVGESSPEVRMATIHVLIWNEGRHETQNPRVAEIYPEGIHGALAAHLRKCADMQVQTATLLTDSDHGLSDERVKETDVLIWWGHLAHQEVSDAVVDRVQKRVLEGMGLIVLHSAHFSRIFKRLMGTTCDLKWREHDDREILWVTRPGHPITQGVDDHFILDREEMYGEFFDIPEPQETLFISSFSGGEVFRSGCTWTRGAGRIFYFRPGHETYPTYHDRNVLKVIENSVRWARAAHLLQPEAVFGQRPAGWIDSKLRR